MNEKIFQLFHERFRLEVPSNDVDLVETGVLDSRTLAELLVHLQRQFGINVSVMTVEIDNFRTVSTIAEFVLRHL